MASRAKEETPFLPLAPLVLPSAFGRRLPRVPILDKKCLRVPCAKCGAKAGVTCKLVADKTGNAEAPSCHDERIAWANATIKGGLEL